MFRRLTDSLCALLIAAMLIPWAIGGIYAHAAGEALPLQNSVPFKLKSESALMEEASTGRVIFQKNAAQRRPAASVTKLMPLLLIFEALENGRCSLNDSVTVSRRAEGMGGSQALLDAGAVYPLETLLKSIIVGSANDSTVALSEYLYGSEEGMVARMNARAQELGMADTHFVNSTGLPAKGHYTTAYDIAVLSREVLKHGAYFSYSRIWLDELRHPSGRVTQLTNTNRLTRLYEGCDGLKTGCTHEAGFCMSATAKRADMRLIVVALGAPSSKERFADVEALFDHGFANYELYTVARRGDIVEKAFPVAGGDPEAVNIIISEDCTALIERGRASDIRLERTLPDMLSAPLNAGQRVGSMRAIMGENMLRELDAVVDRDVRVQGIREGWKRIMRLWLYL